MLTMSLPSANAPAFSASEVARWMGLSPRRVQRWASGYTSATGKDKSPLISRQHEEGLSFLELIELRYALQFFKHGFKHDSIVRALEQARLYTGVEHPFAYKKVYCTGSDLFINLSSSRGEVGKMFSLLNVGQIGLDPVVLSPANEIQWDANDFAERWYPRGVGHAIVVDPAINYGTPVIAGTRITTAQLAAMKRAGETSAAISAMYGLTKYQVREALAFEERRPRHAA